jgi:hypothetical protein
MSSVRRSIRREKARKLGLAPVSNKPARSVAPTFRGFKKTPLMSTIYKHIRQQDAKYEAQVEEARLTLRDKVRNMLHPKRASRKKKMVTAQ